MEFIITNVFEIVNTNVMTTRKFFATHAAELLRRVGLESGKKKSPHAAGIGGRWEVRKKVE
jgi:hypothetical protein